MSSANLRLGIDIGGSHIRVGTVDPASGRIVQLAMDETPAGGDPLMLSALLARLAGAACNGDRIPEIAGVAMPGIWDRQSGRVLRALNLPWLEGCDIRTLVSDALGRRVFLETDVTAAGWAQRRKLVDQVGRDIRRFVYLAIGTGVGASVWLDPVFLRHTRNGPGHIGHLLVDTTPAAPRCACGGRGCLEAIVGGAARRRRGTEAAWGRPESEALANAIVHVVHLFAPEYVAMGGGVLEHTDNAIESTLAALEERRTRLFPDDLRVVAAPVRSDEAGVIGAALSAAE